MARGNNGNALQHVVELACAQHLLSVGEGLRLLSTHGMAPSESLEDAEKPGWETATGSRQLARLLRLASEHRRSPGELLPALAVALAELNCSKADYPNSARLLEWAAKRAGKPFAARVIERKPNAFDELKKKSWGADTRVDLIRESWRYVRDGRNEQGRADPALKLELYGDSSWPWVWSMDPYTFVADHHRNPGSMDDADIQSLAPALKRAFAEAEGVFALFCYSMDASTAERFRASATALHAAVFAGDQPRPVFLGIEKDKATVHLAALLSNCAGALGAAEGSLSKVAGNQLRR